MKFIATVEDAKQKYDIHLDLPDDDSGRARVADALAEIQQRFAPRAETKKTAPRAATPVRASHPATTGDGTRDK